MTAEEIVAAGNVVLAPTLAAAGFRVEGVRTEDGSGGSFAVCRWGRSPQWIELHVRSALGIVRYGWGDEAFDQDHMVDSLGVSAAYPGFSDDPLDGFRHLAEDLSGPLAPIPVRAVTIVAEVRTAATLPTTR